MILPMCVDTSGGSKEDRARLSCVVFSGRTRGSEHKRTYRIFHSNIWENFYLSLEL